MLQGTRQVAKVKQCWGKAEELGSSFLEWPKLWPRIRAKGYWGCKVQARCRPRQQAQSPLPMMRGKHCSVPQGVGLANAWADAKTPRESWDRVGGDLREGKP